jgi:hypothetical protein
VSLPDRERRLIAGVGTILLAGLIAVVVAVVLNGSGVPRRVGCISVGLAYSTGGEQIDRCGAAARALCAGVGRPGGIPGRPGRTVAVVCRRAGLPVG